MSLFRNYRRVNRHGAESWDLRASTDGFANSVVFLSSFDISGSASNEQVVFSDVDISALGTLPSAVSFRLYGYDAGGNFSFSGLSNEDGTRLGGSGSDLILGGLVSPASPLPEPVTIMVLAFGALAYLFAATTVRDTAKHHGIKLRRS